VETSAAGDLAGERCLRTKAKLLIVGAFPTSNVKIFGGVATACRALASSSLSQRFDLVFVDSTQRSNPPPGLPMRALLGFKRGLAFCKALLIERPDALMLFCSVGGSLLEKGAMARLGRMAGIPALIFPRGGKLMDVAAASSLHRLWIRWSLRGANRLLCQGPAWQRFAVDVIGFSPSSAPIVPNWTATNELLAVGRGRGNQHPETDVQILFVGWLEKEKGIFELLQACVGLASEHSFRLVIAGRGRAEDAAREFVRESALADRVEFAGWVEALDLVQLFSCSDVLVLASWAEGLPNAMIEAMAAGVAVVVSAVGNVPDVVADGREALLVPPRDVAAIRRAIQRLLNDPPMRKAIAARGHEFVRKNYAVEPAIEILSREVRAAIEDRQHGLSGAER
jgi:glycosyltransferase involved in cell wall biosynthesis